MRLIRLLKKDLARESTTWVAKGLISRDQARAICNQYDIDYDAIQNRSTGYQLLVSLGYLFIGLALITLLGANWDEIPRAVRLAGVLVITLGTQGVALWYYAKKKVARAVGLFFLGNLFFGAAIILIAQIYHLGEHMPDGVFWWALGSLPFGVLLRHPGLTLFSSLLALVWFFLEYSMGFFPSWMPVFIAAGIYVLIQGRPSVLLFLTVAASVGLWVEASLSAAWTGEHQRMTLYAEHFFVAVALFVFAYAFSVWLHTRDSGKAKDYGVILSLWSLRFGLVAMLVLTYAEPWKALIEADWKHQVSMWQIVGLLLGGSLWLGWRLGRWPWLVPIVAFCGLTMVAVLAVDDAAHALYFQVLYNLALVGAGIGLILHGIRAGISHYFFLGIAAVLLVAFIRYVDLIGDYIGGAALFMVLAVMLLGAARYWKQQHKEGGR